MQIRAFNPDSVTLCNQRHARYCPKGVASRTGDPPVYCDRGVSDAVPLFIRTGGHPRSVITHRLVGPLPDAGPVHSGHNSRNAQ